jgi:aryl-alcohol dehydrogenase-like predicted oxidoreductase
MSSKFILGTVQFGLNYGINNKEGKASEEEVNNILLLASKSGIRILDTAYSYGNAMEQIGDFHKSSDHLFEVNTKFKIEKENVTTISEQLLESLTCLAISSVDTYFYHSFEDYINNPGILAELNQLRKKKYFKKIGVSIYNNDEMLNCINNDAIDVIQLPFNLFDNHNQRGELIREAKKNNKEIHIRSVFLQGLFFMNPANLSLNLTPLAPYLAEIQKIAMELDISIAELALAYVKKEPYIDRIIIGVDSAKQLENNFLASVFEMNDYTYNLINRLVVNEKMLLNPQNWK